MSGTAGIFLEFSIMIIGGSCFVCEYAKVLYIFLWGGGGGALLCRKYVWSVVCIAGWLYIGSDT